MTIINLGNKSPRKPPIIDAIEKGRIYIEWGDMRLVLTVDEAKRLRYVLDVGIEGATEDVAL